MVVGENAARRREAALDLAARGFRIHPVHGFVDGNCTCGTEGECNGPAKHPRLQDWPGRATTVADTICAWWDRWPDANLAVATGTGSALAWIPTLRTAAYGILAAATVVAVAVRSMRYPYRRHMY